MDTAKAEVLAFAAFSHRVACATAAMCVRAGLGDVLVLERAELASGPSGRAGGVLAPEQHAWTDPADFVEFGRHSLMLTRQLDHEWDNALGVRNLDCLLAGRNPDQVSTPLAAPFDVLDERQVRDHEPSVRGITEAVLIRSQAHVDPLRFAAGLARHAGTVATNVAVTDATTSGREVRTLHTTVGDIHPDAVVYATGYAPADSVSVPHTGVKGHLAVNRPVACALRSRVVSAAGGTLPLPDGRLLTGGTIDKDAQPCIQQAVLDQIHRNLHAVIPTAKNTAFSHVPFRVCGRATDQPALTVARSSTDSPARATPGSPPATSEQGYSWPPPRAKPSRPGSAAARDRPTPQPSPPRDLKAATRLTVAIQIAQTPSGSQILQASTPASAGQHVPEGTSPTSRPR